MKLKCHRLRVILLWLKISLGDLILAEPPSGWFDCSWAVFWATLQLEYFGESTVRVTVQLEYLNCTFIYVVPFCFIIYWSSIQFYLGPFKIASPCSQQISTHFFTVYMVCVIKAETLLFNNAQELYDFTKDGLSFVS